MSRFRNWIATYNNPPLETSSAQEIVEELHKKVKANYTIGQLEKGNEEGTIHLQLAFNFKNAVRPGAFKGIKMWTQGVNRDNGIFDYASKQETRVEGPFEFGVRPVRRNNKTDWEQVFEDAKGGNFENIPANIKVQHYSNLQKIRKDNIEVRDSQDVRGVWIWGAAGIGKSRKARQDYPAFYPKLCNKWWDGYKGERHVIMDDIGPDHKCLAQQLKLWGDRYGCILETKGGAIGSNFDKFIVTSQYSIDDIFGEDQRTVDALKRRFKVIHMVNLN